MSLIKSISLKNTNHIKQHVPSKNNTLKHIKFCLFFLCLNCSIFCFSQNDHPFVKFSEVDEGKRLLLVAENKDSIPYSVFLRIETKNFRRSGTRPILTTIEPKSKITLLELIHIKGKPKTYEKIFIVNTITHSLDIKKDFSDFYSKINKEIDAKQITLITSSDCTICNDSKAILKENNIPFKEINKSVDQIKYLRYTKTNKIDHLKSSFIVEINNIFYSDLTSVKDFISTLKTAWD